MTTFVLVPGAGGAAEWYWRRVADHLRAAGHAAIPVDLPADDPEAGLSAYAHRLAAAADGRGDVVLVAQSMGAFAAVPACGRIAVRALVLNNAMIPNPGERAGDWWDNTGSGEARVAAAREHGYPEAYDTHTYFLHDLPPDAMATAEEGGRPEADIAFEEPCPFDAWPDVPTVVIAGRDDRFFPFAFQRRVAAERLGLDAVRVPGGHLNALSEPEALARAVLAETRS